MHPEPRRRSRHSRGEKYVLAGGAGQNMISFSFPACGRGNSARRALPGESVGRKGIGYPAGKLPPPQSLPLGGRTVRGTVRSGPGEATINHRWAGAAGSDEGAIWYPTFPCRKGEALVSRPGGIFLLPRWATRSPPHQSPSVTASPQGEASGLWSPTRKSVPNQGMYMGTVIAYRPEQCGTTAKTSECQRAGPKLGGRGATPRDSLRPGFL